MKRQQCQHAVDYLWVHLSEYRIGDLILTVCITSYCVSITAAHCANFIKTPPRWCTEDTWCGAGVTSVPLSVHSHWDRLASDSNWLRPSDRAPHACRCLRGKFPGMSRWDHSLCSERIVLELGESLSNWLGKWKNQEVGQRGYWDIHDKWGGLLCQWDVHTAAQHLHCRGWSGLLRHSTVSYWL